MEWKIQIVEQKIERVEEQIETCSTFKRKRVLMARKPNFMQKMTNFV